jgi:hypothetical protein
VTTKRIDATAGAARLMGDDGFFPALEAVIGDIAGQRVYDLAGRQGRTARHKEDPR